MLTRAHTHTHTAWSVNRQMKKGETALLREVKFVCTSPLKSEQWVRECVCECVSVFRKPECVFQERWKGTLNETLVLSFLNL